LAKNPKRSHAHVPPSPSLPLKEGGGRRSKGQGATRPAHLGVPMAAPNMRIGLLGGSFNPAHAAHRKISLGAMKRLRLDQVWWLVTPGNPLKAKTGTEDLETRIATARAVAGHPRIVVTGFEAARPSPYTVDTIRFLKRRYPAVKFVWLMGADNLASFHRWHGWETLFRLVPIAVIDRPGYRLKARASRAAHRFASAVVDETDAPGLAGMQPPAWTLLTLPLSGLSSTRLRSDLKGKAKRGASRDKGAGKDEKKAVEAAKRHAKEDTKTGKRDAKATKKSKKKP
jgi:nicotinate-nucleotide adenylyltransferase